MILVFLCIGILLYGILRIKSKAGLFAVGVVGTLLCGLQCLLVLVAGGLGFTGEVSSEASISGVVCIFSVIGYWVLSSYKASRGESDGED